MTRSHFRCCGWQALSLLALLTSAACQSAAVRATPTSKGTRTPSATSSTPSRTQPSVPGIDLRGVGIELWHPWYGAEASLIESQTAEFNKGNEWGITVRTRGHTSFTELYNALTEALPGKEGPDVVIALSEHAVAWDTDGYVVDLTSYIANPSYGLGNDVLEDFPKVFLDQDNVDGRQLGLPAQRTAHLIIYNVSWAQELGFDDPPMTAQDFREQACAAHAALLRDDDPANDARGGWLVRTDAMTFLSWMMAFDGDVLDGSGYRFLSPRNLEATVFLKQMYDDGCGWLGTGGGTPAAAFTDRQALFGTAPMEELSEMGRAMATAENTDDWTVLSFPGEVRPGLIIRGSSFVMLQSTSKEQLAAWLFMSWMLEPEQQEKWVEVTGLFPLRSSLEVALDDYARTHPQWEAALRLVPDGRAQPHLASWRQVRVMIGDGFDAMFRADTPAGRVAEILAIMDRTARDLSP
jgi:ABC-type glycerol-3-phosphate transport system substrate-binding protein